MWKVTPLVNNSKCSGLFDCSPSRNGNYPYDVYQLSLGELPLLSRKNAADCAAEKVFNLILYDHAEKSSVIKYSHPRKWHTKVFVFL